MEENRIICPTCGQPFQADVTKKQVFCVNCGTMIDRTKDVAAMAGQSAAEALDEHYETVKEAFHAVRFPVIDKKTGKKGDRLVELWTTLIYHGINSRSRWATQAATKDIGQFFNRKIWQDVLGNAGPDKNRLIIDELLDSAVVYLSACRDDSRYGSQLLGMVRMSSDAIVAKTASDICQNIIGFLLRIQKPGETDAIIHAIVMAFPRVFPTQRQMLADAMAELLTPEEQTAALTIVARVAEQSRRS
jgi:predicted RNA-binding Zn-ribbon protein involved in translation (DUF1610 family)